MAFTTAMDYPESEADTSDACPEDRNLQDCSHRCGKDISDESSPSSHYVGDSQDGGRRTSPPNTAAASSNSGAGWAAQHRPNTNSAKDEDSCRQCSDGLVTPVPPEEQTLPFPRALSVCNAWEPPRGEPFRPPRLSPQLTCDYAEPRCTQPGRQFDAWPQACSFQIRSHTHEREIPYGVEQPANSLGGSPASGSRASFLGMPASWGSLCAGCSRRLWSGTGCKKNTYALPHSSYEHGMARAPAGMECFHRSSVEPFVPRSHRPTPPHTWTSNQFASTASARHRAGRCKPCAFVHQGGCTNGLRCEFCHLCGPDEIKSRKRERLRRVKLAYQLRRFGRQFPPSHGEWISY